MRRNIYTWMMITIGIINIVANVVWTMSHIGCHFQKDQKMNDWTKTKDKVPPAFCEVLCVYVNRSFSIDQEPRDIYFTCFYSDTGHFYTNGDLYKKIHFIPDYWMHLPEAPKDE